MTELGRPLIAGIVDFNPKRMTSEEARAHGIPIDLVEHFGDWRQYPPNIAKHFPDNVSWFRAEHPWYFGSVMTNEKHLKALRESDILFLSGSGLSAYRYQHGEGPAEFQKALETSQSVVRDHLGEGKWIFGICFGGQEAEAAVGATIGRLPDNVTEAGWLPHNLTEAGKRDEVFSFLPITFYAPHFHNDFVEKLPEVGAAIQTSSGDMHVVRAEVLATRRGYLGRNGLENSGQEYIMASVIEFDNGARLYQIQPHPEMATPEKANFLVRTNKWMGEEKEMGQSYYQQALKIPPDGDFSVAKVIPNFVRLAQGHLEEKQGITFMKATLVKNIFQHLLP